MLASVLSKITGTRRAFLFEKDFSTGEFKGILLNISLKLICLSEHLKLLLYNINKTFTGL